MKIKISNKSLQQKFTPCTEEYIASVCKGRCCQGTGRLMITIHPSEVERIEKLGAKVQDGFIVAVKSGLCPFKNEKTGLCSIHYDNKPFGCKASPFTLTKKDTLIIRNRYRMLKCYKCDNKVPVWQTHNKSLETIFGKEEADRIIKKVQETKEDFYAEVPEGNYKMLKDNDYAKQKIKNV